MGPIGFLDVITSPLNTSNVLQNQIDGGNGRRRSVDLRFAPRLPENLVQDGALQSCDGGEQFGDTVERYEIDPATEGSNLTSQITLAELQTACETNEFYFAQNIERMMGAMRRMINLKSLQEAKALVGNFVGGAATKTVTTATSGVVPFGALQEILYQYRDAEGVGSPVVIGQDLIEKYFIATNAGCCATQNVDLGLYAAQNPAVFVRDGYIESAWGANHFLVMEPGAYQLLTFNEFRGVGAELSQPTYMQGVLRDPMTGLNFDYLAHFDCGVWKYQLKLAHKIVALPASIYLTGDRLAGVNGTFDFIAQTT
jgi:hypothetical protein